MPIDLYHSDASPFCRSVRLTAEAIGLKLNLIPRNIHEHNPDIKAINPTHTLPTLVDGDLNMWESRAIMTYLVSKYGANDHLYPKDLKKRAHVDKFLYYDCGNLNAALWGMVVPMMRKKREQVDEEDAQKFVKSMGFLEEFLEGNKWVAGGDHFTLADIAIAVTLSVLKEGGHTFAKYPNVKAWLERCEKEMPGYSEVNLPGAKVLASKAAVKIDWDAL